MSENISGHKGKSKRAKSRLYDSQSRHFANTSGGRADMHWEKDAPYRKVGGSSTDDVPTLAPRAEAEDSRPFIIP